MLQLPPELQARTYVAADGEMAWRAEDIEQVLRMALDEGLRPRLVEAWMVFESGPFAGTHCATIHVDENRSALHRLPLDGEREPWDAARRFVIDCPAAREVDRAYADTIRFHVGFEASRDIPFD